MIEKILILIAEHKFGEICEILKEANVVDIAALLEELSYEDALRVFRLMPKEKAAETFSYMSRDLQQKMVEAITDRELSGIMSELFLDDTVDLIEEMPANVVKKVLANTDIRKRSLINQFLQYAENSAGSLMTIEFVDLKKEMTVKQAFKHIRETGMNKETIYTCYVTDNSRRLEGLVTVKTLLLSNEQDVIEDIMDTNVIFAHTDDDTSDVTNKFQKYDILSIPVVDKETRLVGIITVDDAIEALQEENTEDFEIMAALTPSDEPYLKTSAFTHSKNRILWLLVLMLSSTFTGTIMTRFENAFLAIPVLVAFVPMMMSTGGNCGSQASTLVIRGMALDEIRGRDVLWVWWKEICVALIVGFVLTMVNVIRIWLLYKSMSLALTVGLSLYAVVIISKSVGCLLPIAAKQVKLDPAIMAAPIITTIVDACSLLIYFSLAKAILAL